MLDTWKVHTVSLIILISAAIDVVVLRNGMPSYAYGFKAVRHTRSGDYINEFYIPQCSNV